MHGVLIAIRYFWGLLTGGLWITQAQLVPLPVPGLSVGDRAGAVYRALPSVGWVIVRPESGTFGELFTNGCLSVFAHAVAGGGQRRWRLPPHGQPRSRI